MTETVQDLSAHAVLRSRTAAAHEAVDGAFGHFDLAERESYRDFLTAHAAALPLLEALLLRHSGALPPWRSRLALLEADLAALGTGMPAPLKADLPSGEAEVHGLLYVLEGSRLGGKMLARQVPDALPCAFLGAGHLKGEWRAFLQALNERAEREAPAWLDRAVDGATLGFGLYRRAAGARAD